MKILHYFGCALLASALLVSCKDDADENIVHLANSGETNVIVSGVDTDYGYPGDQFTITGENFGGATDFIKVSIGEKEAEILSCSNEQIKAVVPSDATTGKIIVEFMGEVVSNSIRFRVMGNPEVLAMNPLFGEEDAKCWGMPGGTIKLYGALLGGSEKDVEVLFGKTEAEIIAWSENEIEVMVPDDINDDDELTLNIGSIEEVNLPCGFMLVRPLVVEELSPAEGYAGCSVEIIGIGLGSGEMLEQTQVWFGETVVSVDEEETEDGIRVTLPAGMSEGDYAVRVKTPFEDMTSTVTYKVVEEPSSFSCAGLGYVGNTIEIMATNLPTAQEYVSVMIGDTEAEITAYDAAGGKLTAELPADLTAGDYVLKFVYSGKEFSVDTDFEVKAAPVVSSYDRMVFSGGSMVISGTNLDELSDKLTLTFDGTQVSPVEATENSITFTVPSGTNEKKDAKVLLEYEDGIIATTELDVTVIPAAGADGYITEYVLENAGPDFESDGNDAASWIKSTSPAFKGNSLYRDGSESYLSFNAGATDNQNSYLYQNIVLPRGKYQVEITVADIEQNGGNRNGVVFGIMEGHDTRFPSLTDQGSPWHFTTKEGVLCEYNLKEGHDDDNDGQTERDEIVKKHTTASFVISNQTELTFGFAIMQGATRYLRISEIKIKVVE